MPTLSASDYTQFLKFKAASISSIRPAIQTRDNVSTSQSLINANLLASQAALVATPQTSQTYTIPAVVTDVSTKTVTTARTNIIQSAVGGSNVILYTTSQPHGLTGSATIVISGLAQNTLTVDPNGTKLVLITGASTFTFVSTGVTGSSSGTGRIQGRVYYTTSVAHGLIAGDTVTISGLTTFNMTNKTVLAAPSATTFVVDDTTTGTAETGQTATIGGIIYYTTDVAHGFLSGRRNVTIRGITGTTVFNISLATLYRIPSATVFTIQSSITGDTVDSQSGVITYTDYGNTTTAITGNARVQGQQVVQTRSNPNALSTIGYAGTSGALSSSRTQQPGGLPTGFKNSQGTYTRLPQNAGWIQGGAGMVSSGPRRF
jgi:hypothetical protein